MASFSSVDEEGGVQIWESISTNTRLPPLGRILNTVLSARPGQLEALLSQRSHHEQRGTLNEAVTALGKHAEEMVQRNEPLDQMLLPLLQHVVKFKGMQNRKKVVLLLQWLSQNEDTFTVLADGLEKLLVENDDHHIVLGWCIVVRELIEKRAITGSQHRYAEKLFKICCRCIHRLLSIVHGGRNEKPGNHGKFDSLWLGPYIIREAAGQNSYHLSTLDGESLELPVNGQLLKMFHKENI